MHKRIVGVFTVAGVLAAGTSAYAINSQALNGYSATHVGVATADLSKNAVVSSAQNSLTHSPDSRHQPRESMTPKPTHSPRIVVSPNPHQSVEPKPSHSSRVIVTPTGTSQPNPHRTQATKPKQGHSRAHAVNGSPIGQAVAPTNSQPPVATDPSFPPIVPPPPPTFSNNDDDDESESPQDSSGRNGTRHHDKHHDKKHQPDNFR